MINWKNKEILEEYIYIYILEVLLPSKNGIVRVIYEGELHLTMPTINSSSLLSPLIRGKRRRKERSGGEGKRGTIVFPKTRSR